MSDKVLYRAWRPQTFDDVVGQEHVVSALRQSVISKDIAHAYLFSGMRGTGKTSLAKIFARAINCLNVSKDGNPCNQCEICTSAIKGNLLDIIEMDAASNNSVDDIRKITDEVMFMPTMAKYKVYIIDEVHMLSISAFNALLKTLEEPPAHVVFILATTDPQRIPATIISRCQRYDFKRIPAEQMLQRLRLIAAENEIDIDDEALQTIIAFSEGALRDAISLLDQSRSVFKGKITRDDILSMSGVVSDELLEKIVFSLIQGDVDGLLQSIDQLIMNGGDLNRFASSLAQYLRNVLVYKTSKNSAKLLQVPAETLTSLAMIAPLYSSKDLIAHISFLAKLQQELKYAENPRITLEVGLIELLQNIKSDDFDPDAKARVSQNKSIEVNKNTAGSAENPGESLGKKQLDGQSENQIENQSDGRFENLGENQPENQTGTQAENQLEEQVKKQVKTKLNTQAQAQALSSSEKQTEEQSQSESSAESKSKINNRKDSSKAKNDFMDLTSLLQAKTKKTEPEGNESGETKSLADAEKTSEVPAAAEDTASTKSTQTAETSAFTSWSETESVPEPLAAAENLTVSGMEPQEESNLTLNTEQAQDENTLDKTDTNAELIVLTQAELDYLWEKFLNKLGDKDPLLAILLNSCRHYVDANKFYLDFAADQKDIYDKINTKEVLAKLKLTFRAVNDIENAKELELALRLAGETVDSDINVKREPEWVARMREVARQLDVPINEENQNQSNNQEDENN